MFSATKGGSPSGYQISRSVRLRSSASAYFARTFTTPTNNKIWTYSVWMKRGSLSANRTIMSSNVDGAEYWDMRFNTSDQILIQNRVGSSNLLFANTTAVYRDPSAWYHIFFVFDSDNATPANRNLLYVNNVNVSLSANSGSGNASAWNTSGVQHNIGVSRTLTTGGGIWAEFDGYETEINFIDGQALTPAAFGETNPVTGVWQPKRYTGTYGTNGFYLNFSDNSAATAAAIGKDYSGNGNNWTPNNISVTTGATYDSMLDVPTQWADGGNGRGNYATLNPLAYEPNAGRFPNLSEANLKATNSANNVQTALGTFGISSGKFYCEFTVGSAGANNGNWIGVMSLALASGYSNARLYNAIGQYYNGSAWASYGATFTAGDVLGIALDMDSQTLEFFKNGSSQGQKTSVGLSGLTMTAAVSSITTGENMFANFGQRPFAYTPPSGFKALNTLNLPEPTISNGANYMAATTYTGTGSALSVSNAVNGVSFQPDFVWTKPRSTAVGHTLFDSLRGVTKYLQSNTTGAEGTAATSLTAFNSDGFTVNSDTSTGANGVTYIGWQWKEGATQGFDIVTYTGTGSAATTVAHGLGVVPAMIITKARSGAGEWMVKHQSLPSGQNCILNQTLAASTSLSFSQGVIANLTSSTTFGFTAGSSGVDNANQSGVTYVAYLFAAVAGYSAFGSYTGNGSADGTFVYLGFRPRFVLFKRTDSTASWYIYDTSRNTFNTMNNWLSPNQSVAENTSTTWEIDIVSNGFKIRNSGAFSNANGGTYIYAAFCESPFKNSLAR